MNIGEVAQRSGLSVKMVRYYEAQGLVPAARRSEGGFRRFSEPDVKAFRFVRRARDLGFPVQTIRRLVALWQDSARSNADVKSVLMGHAAGVDKKIAELGKIRERLQSLVSECAGDGTPGCPILDNLASGPPGRP